MTSRLMKAMALVTVRRRRRWRRLNRKLSSVPLQIVPNRPFCHSSSFHGLICRPTSFLASSVFFCRHGAGERGSVAHEARLRCHHLLFGRAVKGTLVLKRGFKEL